MFGTLIGLVGTNLAIKVSTAVEKVHFNVGFPFRTTVVSKAALEAAPADTKLSTPVFTCQSQILAPEVTTFFEDITGLKLLSVNPTQLPLLS